MAKAVEHRVYLATMVRLTSEPTAINCVKTIDRLPNNMRPIPQCWQKNVGALVKAKIWIFQSCQPICTVLCFAWNCPFDMVLALSAIIELIPSSARVTSAKML